MCERALCGGVGACGCLGCGRVFVLRACHVCVMRAVASASWTGCDDDECFWVCMRCVMGWSDAAACMGVV